MKKKGLRPLDHDIIDTVVYQTFAHRIVFPGHAGHDQLGSDSVRAADQHRLFQPETGQRVHAAEMAYLAEHLAAESLRHPFLEGFLGFSGRLEIDSGLLVAACFIRLFHRFVRFDQ